MKTVIHYKSTIFSILNVISIYALSKGIITIDEATLISGLIFALWGTANIMIPKSK